MIYTILGVASTFIAPFGVIGLATIARKLGLGAEASRKLAHILLSNWILLALAVYHSAWAAVIAPACFIVLNYLSYRKGIFSAIERGEDNTPGTVWFAVSLFLLCFAGFSLEMPWIAACGILAMGYGDGFGALVGKRWGKSRFPGVHSKKSLEGMLTVLALSGMAVGLVCAAYAPELASRFALRAALACAAPAAVIELYSPRGIDNLTLPIGISLIVFLLARYPQLWPVFACLGITLLILVAAYYLRALTFGGLQAATFLGVAFFVSGGWLCFAALVLFFVLGSAASRIGKDKKADANALHERRGPRSAVQVAANGLPPLIFSALYYITGLDAFLLAVLACFAAAAADTLSSEIGMLSKKAPVSILTRKPMQRGMSGGVSGTGFLGAALGALIVSALAIPGFGVTGMAAVFVAGFAGSLIDSALGAAFQAKYHASSGDAEEGAQRLTERSSPAERASLTERSSLDGAPLRLASGIRWVNNDAVNFIGLLICGAAIAAVW